MPSLKKNLIYNVIYQVLVIVLPLITAPYISRVLGADGIGTYSYVYSIAYYFGLCGMLGISNQGSRCIALSKYDRDKASHEFSNLYFVQLITSTIALFIYILFSACFFSGDKTIAFIDILFVISYLLDINWFFFGMEQFKITITRNIVIKILTVCSIFLLVKTKSDLWLYTLIMASGAFLSQVYLWLQVRKFIDIKAPLWKDVKKNIRPVLILFIPVAAYSIYMQMDKIMIGALTNVTQVGYYDNAEKIINIPVGFINAFGTVMMPRISTLVSVGNNSQIKKYNQMSFRYFTILVCAAVFGLIGISDILAPVYFGNEFIPCAPLIKGLSVTLIFMTWANIIRTQYLIPNKKDSPYVISTLCGAGINLIFNLIFIPIMGAEGALIGTVLAETSVFVVQAILVRKEFPVFKLLLQTMPFFIFGVIMALCVHIIGDIRGESIMTLIIQVAFGAAVYLGICFIYLLFVKDEILKSLIVKISKRR